MAERTDLTREEFEQVYAVRSRIPAEKLRAYGRMVIPCRCGERDCQGWISVSREAARDELNLGRITQAELDEAYQIYGTAV